MNTPTLSARNAPEPDARRYFEVDAGCVTPTGFCLAEDCAPAMSNQERAASEGYHVSETGSETLSLEIDP